MTNALEVDSTSGQCAIYAHYSSNMARAESLENQEKCCRELALANSLEVLDQHIYTDAARTGSIRANLPGLAALEEAVRDPKRRFNRVLFDDTWRLSRDLGDILKLEQSFKPRSRTLLCESTIGLHQSTIPANAVGVRHGRRADDRPYPQEIPPRRRRPRFSWLPLWERTLRISRGARG
jgi:hypothetical protein